MKKQATQKTVDTFIRAVYPAMTALAVTLGTEESILRDATEKIIASQNAIEELLCILKSAIARVEMANTEGNNIMSAWLPDAKAAIARAEGRE